MSSVGEWRVSNEVSLSDHRHILFTLLYATERRTTYRNPRNTNWEMYRDYLRESLSQTTPNKFNKVDEIDAAAEHLQKCIISSYEASCPIKNRKESGNPPWWGAELEGLRKETRKLFNKAKRTRLPQDWETFKDTQRRYKSAIKSSKKKSWRRFCENVESVPQLSRFHKIIGKDPEAGVGSLLLPSGEFTSSDKEALKLLLETHFPGSKESEEMQQRRPPTRPVRTDWRLASSIVKYDLTKWAVMSFSPYKSAGEDGVFPALLQEGQELVLLPMVRIFRSCLAYGYIPKRWRATKVVFIPKPGKRDYT